MIYLIDMVDAITAFDDIVMDMDNQDYDLDEIVTNWLLGEREEDLDAYYSNYLRTHSDNDSYIDDGPILAKGVKKLYRRMDRDLRELDRSKIRRLYLRKDEHVLVVEVN